MKTTYFKFCHIFLLVLILDCVALVLGTRRVLKSEKSGEKNDCIRSHGRFCAAALHFIKKQDLN